MECGKTENPYSNKVIEVIKMSEQIFISYRRDGGDVTAKLICEALKNKGYSVFYDFDSLQGGYFDERILRAIEGCTDFVLVLPAGSLDRCKNENDWVRLEIKHAIKNGKNIIPVMLPGFSFPKDLPEDIASISRINGVAFVMAYFDVGVVPSIIDRLSNTNIAAPAQNQEETQYNDGLEFIFNPDCDCYLVSGENCELEDVVIPSVYKGKPVLRVESFFGNTKIRSVKIPNGVNYIGISAFEECTSLKSVTIPGSVKNIGFSAFGGCSSLESVVVEDGVETIDDNAFGDCENLRYVKLPASLKYVYNGLFSGCVSLDKVYFDGTVDMWSKIDLGYENSVGKWIKTNKLETVLTVVCFDGEVKV